MERISCNAVTLLDSRLRMRKQWLNMSIRTQDGASAMSMREIYGCGFSVPPGAPLVKDGGLGPKPCASAIGFRYAGTRRPRRWMFASEWHGQHFVAARYDRCEPLHAEKQGLFGHFSLGLSSASRSPSAY